MIAMPRVTSTTGWLNTIQGAIDRARRNGVGSLVCSVTPIDAVDLGSIFSAARRRLLDCAYWERPDQVFTILGMGSAVTLEAEGEMRFATIDREWRHLRESMIVDRDALTPTSIGPMLLGGFAFTDQPSTSPEWRDFPPARFVVPRTTIVRRGDRFWRLRCVRVTGSDAAGDVAATFDREDRLLAESLSIVEQSDSAMSVPVDMRGRSAWERLVAQGTDAITSGIFEKVVLARAVRLRSDAFDLQTAIANLGSNYPGCTVFAIGRGGGCFLGATPERLVRLIGDNVAVSCIAGTAARGASDVDDERLGAELLASDKNRREHAYVVETIINSLADNCVAVDAPETPELLRVRNLQHLHTPVTATIKSDRSLFDLVAGLHPTSAVGGTPREPALTFIADHEELDRGWYAAPVGWIDESGNGEFAVALRSAIIQQRENTADAYLFAGCGIVAGSQPEAELLESTLKLRPMLTALGGSHS